MSKISEGGGKRIKSDCQQKSSESVSSTLAELESFKKSLMESLKDAESIAQQSLKALKDSEKREAQLLEKNKRSDIELKRLSDKIAELTEINKKTDAAKPPLDNYSHSVGNSNCTEQPLATSKIKDVTLLQSNPLELQSMTSGRAPNVTASRITSAATVGASYGR